MNKQVKNIFVVSADGDLPGEGWVRCSEVNARSVGGAKRSIGRICCEWNAYFGEYEFAICPPIFGMKNLTVFEREVA